MTSTTGFSPKSPNRYLAPNVYLSSVVTRDRRPTGADYRQPETGKLYPTSSFWLISANPTTGVQGELWYLSKISSNVAYWLMLSQSTGPLLNIAVPLGISPIVPDGLGTINFTSSSGTISITGSAANPNNHTINFDLVGGTTAIDSIQVQNITAPGVNPVLPDGAGLMTVNGAVVANHSIVLESRSRALNAYNLEIQYATSAAATDGTKSGVAHFNSTQFSVDAAGFVSLAGGGIALDSLGVQGTSGAGTNPVVPDGTGKIEIQGALVAAGTNPLISVSTAANTLQMQIQQSQALAAQDTTKVGLSNFNSTYFTVTNGFVSLVPSNFTRVVRQVFTSNGTYTPTSGMLYADVEICGGGGGGGGSGATAAGTASGGSGGAGGGYCRKVFTAAAIGASQTVTIGAAGTAGAAGGAGGGAGGNGGTTTFGALISASGGNGGNASIVVGTNAVSAVFSAPGVGTGGDINTYGNVGEGGFGFQTVASGGNGGSSYYGAGGPVAGSPSPGNIGYGFGAGGGAGASANGTGGQVGAVGNAGICIVTEYCS